MTIAEYLLSAATAAESWKQCQARGHDRGGDDRKGLERTFPDTQRGTALQIGTSCCLEVPRFLARPHGWFPNLENLAVTNQ